MSNSKFVECEGQCLLRFEIVFVGSTLFARSDEPLHSALCSVVPVGWTATVQLKSRGNMRNRQCIERGV